VVATTQADEAAVEARGLAKSFGSFRALDGMDLRIRAGEILGLVGPNGAGKTTFIRVVAGLLRPTSGEISVLGGHPGIEVAPRIGYMPQSAALYDDLTVVDNLVFFGRLFGLSRERAHRRADEIVDVVALRTKAKTLVRDLSGGMRQLASLGCSMVHDPRLLLLDEPTVGIDPVLRIDLWRHFADLNAEGTTIVVTTHVIPEAERCHRIAMLGSGRVIALGTADELRARAGRDDLDEAYIAIRDEARREGER
jgi:ABC-2 type transport system ATP-binding protein